MELNTKSLEEKIKELEERIKKLEDLLESYESVETIVWQLLDEHPKLL